MPLQILSFRKPDRVRHAIYLLDEKFIKLSGERETSSDHSTARMGGDVPHGYG